MMGGKMSKAYFQVYYQKHKAKMKAKAFARYVRIKDTPEHKQNARDNADRYHFGMTRDIIFAKTDGECYYCPKKASIVHHLDEDGRSSILKGQEPGKDSKRLIGVCRGCHLKIHYEKLDKARRLKTKGKWSNHYERCRSCKRTDRRHCGKGYCQTCRPRILRHKRQACSL